MVCISMFVMTRFDFSSWCRFLLRPINLAWDKARPSSSPKWISDLVSCGGKWKKGTQVKLNGFLSHCIFFFLIYLCCCFLNLIHVWKTCWSTIFLSLCCGYFYLLLCQCFSTSRFPMLSCLCNTNFPLKLAGTEKKNVRENLELGKHWIINITG